MLDDAHHRGPLRRDIAGGGEENAHQPARWPRVRIRGPATADGPGGRLDPLPQPARGVGITGALQHRGQDIERRQRFRIGLAQQTFPGLDDPLLKRERLRKAASRAQCQRELLHGGQDDRVFVFQFPRQKLQMPASGTCTALS